MLPKIKVQISFTYFNVLIKSFNLNLLLYQSLVVEMTCKASRLTVDARSLLCFVSPSSVTSGTRSVHKKMFFVYFVTFYTQSLQDTPTVGLLSTTWVLLSKHYNILQSYTFQTISINMKKLSTFLDVNVSGCTYHPACI